MAGGTGARSIHQRAPVRALAALMAGAILLVGVTWWLLLRQLDAIFEANLQQVALAVADHYRAGGPAAAPAGLVAPLPRSRGEYGKLEFATVVWTRDGRRLHRSDSAVDLPFQPRSGPGEVMAGGQR